ncbi:metal ABC transporter permease [Phorcysia thermohydrogeniphila]|uniref:Zinc transport system permease protein n=1 Tax=Phorcysia thermohydrogeniphila TaxID=936138 RepID=A0A4R1GHB1_9BACT|nr:metal ABC transporter permease [Phorcysia thermohydrogeniphila]TCK06413.1 zinc transport system permease protein [Phorcysia thermohydrogeniphila]
MELSNPLTYLQYGFGIKALISAILTGITCSAAGTYVILRKMAFIGAGLAHVAFAGVTFGLMLGSSPLLWAFLFSAVAGTALWYLSTKKAIHYDVTIGVLFATSMGLAVIFLSFSKSYGSEALSYLFGSPLSVETVDLFLLALATILTFSFYFFFWRDIYLITFSQDIAKASGYKVELLTFTASCLISLVVTLSIKAVGALLVFSLLVMPAASAYRFSRSYGEFFLLSVVFGFITSLLGILLSFTLDVPSGAAITLISFLIFLLSAVK